MTFVIDTNLNYTNVCDAYCTFCAFYRTEKDDDAYTHSVDEMMEMVGNAAARGVTTVLLQGGLNPKLPMEYYEELVRETRKRYPQVLPHYFSAPEIQKMAQVAQGCRLPRCCDGSRTRDRRPCLAAVRRCYPIA